MLRVGPFTRTVAANFTRLSIKLLGGSTSFLALVFFFFVPGKTRKNLSSSCFDLAYYTTSFTMATRQINNTCPSRLKQNVETVFTTDSADSWICVTACVRYQLTNWVLVESVQNSFVALHVTRTSSAVFLATRTSWQYFSCFDRERQAMFPERSRNRLINWFSSTPREFPREFCCIYSPITLYRTPMGNWPPDWQRSVRANDTLNAQRPVSACACFRIVAQR